MADQHQHLQQEEEEDGTILNETQQYIQKMDEVEKFRRESGESAASLQVRQVEAEVNIVVEEYDKRQEEEASEPSEDAELPIVLTVEGGKILADGEEDLNEVHALADSGIEPGIRLTVEGGEILSPEEEEEEKSGDKEADDDEGTHQRNGAAVEEEADEQGEEEEQEKQEEKEDQEEQEDDKEQEEQEEQEEEEKEEEYEYSLKRDPSVRGHKSPEDYYRANGYPDSEVTDHTIYEESLHKPADHIASLIDSSGKIASLHEPVERIASLHEPAERIASLHEPAERIASLHEPAERIANLHEPAEKIATPAEPSVPKPAARGSRTSASSEAAKGPGPSPPAVDREEEDYEARVKVTLRQYKSERDSSNVEVLQKIEGEESGNPDVKKLLAWAKGTRRSTTETMVVRQKTRETQIRKAVDVGGVNLVIAKKEAPPPKAEVKPKAINIQNGAGMVEDISKDWCSKVVMHIENDTKVAVTNIKINHEQGVRTLTVEAEVGPAKKVYAWHLKKATTPTTSTTLDKEAFMLTDLGIKIARHAESIKSRTVLRSPYQTAAYSDNQYILVPTVDGFKRLPTDRALDEAHLKVVAKALAQLHAMSYAYFKSSADSGEAIRILTETAYQGRAEEGRMQLERNLAKIVLALEQEGMSKGEVDKVKGMKNSLTNIYRDATNPNGLFPVLCHGEPSLANLLFKYGADGQPTEAMLSNFSGCRYASAVTDLHVFINTTRDTAAREDFLLRFVYYETLIATLKAYGIKATFSYDDLKSEFVKKRLFGCLESCSILLKQRPEVREVSRQEDKSPTSPVLTSPTGPRPLESKILGRFLPRSQPKPVSPVPAGKNQLIAKAAAPGDQIQPGPRVLELMAAALKI